MSQESSALSCSECGSAVKELPTVVEFEGEEVHVFDPVLCESCLLKLCDQYWVECANCGDKIPPFSQVGVLKANGGGTEYVHMTSRCTTVGSAFHGYYGKGQLRKFIEIEAC